MKIWKLIWIELDFVGVFLLVASLALILIPLTLTGTDSPQTWSSPGIIAMIVIGVVLFAVYIYYDAKIATKPLIPYRLARERTLVFACIIEMLDFLHYAAFTSFFPSFLQVSHPFSTLLHHFYVADRLPRIALRAQLPRSSR